MKSESSHAHLSILKQPIMGNKVNLQESILQQAKVALMLIPTDQYLLTHYIF